MQQLKEFVFRCTGELDSQDVGNLTGFLFACLDTPTLQKLRLDLGEGGDDSPPTIDLGKVLGSRSRPNLTDISFRRADVDLSKLVRFLEGLPKSIKRLDQGDICLNSGTWKEAFDALRKKACTQMEFNTPLGAECEDMPRRDYDRIFTRKEKWGWGNEAEFYITKTTTRNPIEALEDGDFHTPGSDSDSD